MTIMYDLSPAAAQLARLVDGVDDGQLGAATPCGGWPVAVLLDHLLALTAAFTAAARKDSSLTSRPEPDGTLPVDWRSQLHERLDALVAAWRAPHAWEGETEAGGVTMPAEIMGVVALDELVLHGWDLARATVSHSRPIRLACRRAWASPPPCPRWARKPAGRASTVRSWPSRPLLPTLIGCSASRAGTLTGRPARSDLTSMSGVKPDQDLGRALVDGLLCSLVPPACRSCIRSSIRDFSTLPAGRYLACCAPGSRCRSTLDGWYSSSGSSRLVASQWHGSVPAGCDSTLSAREARVIVQYPESSVVSVGGNDDDDGDEGGGNDGGGGTGP